MAKDDTDRSIERHKPLVLVAEGDGIVSRFAMRNFLEQSGFDMVEARNGRESVQGFKDFRPGIVLIDVALPETDGFEACREIRSLPDGMHTPILMLMEPGDVELISKAYDAGATDFITRPINRTILRQRLRYLLRAGCALSELSRNELKNRTILGALPDLMLQMHRTGELIDYRIGKDAQSFKDFGSFATGEDLRNRRIDEVLPSPLVEPTMRYIERTLRTGSAQVYEYKIDSGGEVRYHEARFVVSGNDEVLSIFRDITERKQAEEQVIYLANHDTLTRLPNRRLFRQRLAEALEDARRSERVPAILFLDLDRFKLINDTLGHDMGDLLLQQVAEHLVNCVRKSDSIARMRRKRSRAGIRDSVVARLGGDEFIILLTDIQSADDAARVAERVIAALAQPLQLGNREVFVTTSIGIAVYPRDGRDADTLLGNADAAMYFAKKEGRNNFRFYAGPMSDSQAQRTGLEHSLKSALECGGFQLRYQPQVDTAFGRVTGFEALPRRPVSERELLPEDFIPLAEETGLIVPLGEWVLDAACKQRKKWDEAALGDPRLRVAVNISGSQFRREGLVNAVDRALRASELGPECLELELAQSVMMQPADPVVGILKELKSMGVKLSMNDFGAGYTSFGYLKRLPLDGIKIDRSFLKDIHQDRENYAITRAIIAMAHGMDLEVTAVGVETPQQLESLHEMQCDKVQGILIAPPLLADMVEDFMKARTPVPAL